MTIGSQQVMVVVVVGLLRQARCRFRDFLSRSCSVPEGTALVWMRVFHQTIDLPPFVIFREIFRDR